SSAGSPWYACGRSSRPRRSPVPPRGTRAARARCAPCSSRPGPARCRSSGCSAPAASPPSSSDHLRGQGNDLHEILVAQLARDRPEDARADRLARVVDQDGGVLVEADVGAVPPLLRLVHPDDHRLHHLPLLHVSLGVRLLSVCCAQVYFSCVSTVLS